MSLFGSSGIRGQVGSEITIDLVARIGAAVGSEYGSIIIGNDTRTSTDLVREALVSGATSVGADVALTGLVSTPTLARASKSYECGLMITASHNPPEYNGVKMWNPDGSAFNDEQMRSVESRIEAGMDNSVGWDRVGTCRNHVGAVDEHISSIMESIDDVDLKIVIDCGCGATCNITPILLRKLGCQVVTINCQPDGYFPGRLSEPTEEHLTDLLNMVRAKGADLGIAHDGDGDRMVAVDEKGRFVDGDRLLALFASRFKGGIVVPINASMILDEIVGDNVVRTRVGDVFVSQALKQGGLEFGGEPSGTFIFSDQTYCPDGVYAAALLASMVVERPLSEMVDELPSYPVSRMSFKFQLDARRKVADSLSSMMRVMECDRLLTLDGFRADFEEGWFLIRLSGTEPKIRITAEARDDETLSQLMEKASYVVRRCLE
ncbi:MAG: phosphoglucosamine mutase [Methanomassiliicoccales archaeon]|nr:phosphoglucosamine mutase [Methanomassiliicoccales archaeon]NYT14416.1 phosphoglucosamine mutase [Methanomassiliicoccales archaeon]